MDLRKRLVIVELLRFYMVILWVNILVLSMVSKRKRRRIDNGGNNRYSMKDKIPEVVNYMTRLTKKSERKCIKQLRMGRDAFGRLCMILRQAGGLIDSKHVTAEEQVCLFFSVLSHHKKNCTVEFDFQRSGRTISIYFHKILKMVLKLYEMFVVKPTPMESGNTDPTWKWFEGCLGALDGTLIDVSVPESEKGSYRSRKGKCSVNVLGVCDRNCNFAYVLTGWEGSAADGRVLRDAIQRPNGLKVPEGSYYLCDSGYTNGPGFLSPYRGVRYHIQEWGNRRPTNYKELFNRRHSSARTTVERTFGILKKKWGILRSASYYNIRIQNEIIMACALLHNFIRHEMEVDPVEQEMNEDELTSNIDTTTPEYIQHIEPSQAWTNFRDDLATEMWNLYQGRR